MVKLDPNRFAVALARERGSVWIAEGTVGLPLRRGHPRRVVEDFALVDSRDAHLREFYWSDNQHGYARRRDKDGRMVVLHRQVMGLGSEDKVEVDHINRDRLDNRRSNLRVCSTAENAQNRQPRNSYSKHRGVSYDKQRGKWLAQATLKYKGRFIGRFDTEEEAAEAAAAWRAENMPFANN